MLIRGLVAIGFILSTFVSTSLAQDIGVPDTIRHGCHEVYFYDHQTLDTFSFPLYIFSDDSLEGVVLSICYTGSGVEFLFAEAGQVFNDVPSSSFIATAKPDQRGFALFWIGSPETPLLPLNRIEVFATLYFTSSFGCPEDLEIDTCWLPFVGSTEFVPHGRDRYTPRCFEGWFGTQCGLIACVGVDDDSVSIYAERAFPVARTFPNPFNSGTTIELDIPSSDHLSIVIYDILGRRVRTTVDDFVTRGVHQFPWDGKNHSGQSAASGVYFARITIGSDHAVRKLVLLR